MKGLRYLFIAFVMSGSAPADAIKLVGNIEQIVKIPDSNRLIGQRSERSIALLHLQLSERALNSFENRIPAVLAKSVSPSEQNRQIQLGMGSVPVLDQGSHGTCVLFANTAAIDAALNKGDYISQLCLLELGVYLNNNGYSVSGWNGSWAPIVLNQISMFGIINQEYQKNHGCAGLTEYPFDGAAPKESLSLSDYYQVSEEIPKSQVAWTSLLEPHQAVFNELDMDNLLNDVKIALHTGDRLTFSVLLLNFNQGTVGAIGSHHTQIDSWILTPEMAQDINEQADFAAHEMIITGYDDKAIAVDEQGRTYTGLLTLRNSWGRDMGDRGDFYMSYNYFKALALEVQRIRHL
jgi:hypothetical protein